MIIEVKDSDVFIPTWRGNRELPEPEQIKVTHRFFLPGERKKFIHTEPLVVDIKTGEVDSKVKYVQDETGIVKALVTKIDNLIVKSGGKETPVKDGKDLYLYGVPQELVTEIELYMLSATPEVQEDFLEQPSP